ncbi:MAG: DNA polymerase III subunit gamma/tau [Gammaproteobacteria bacterium]|nr:DNA polymerase III subunit gamma/tau [Gammaproteobacteria bacterium]
MSYQVLARKWRPRVFADMVGQGHVLQALTNALESNRLHHAYLFTGTRGVGKTTLARILAKCLNCERGVGPAPCGECSACIGIDEGRYVDLIEVDAASRAKVDETRDLMDNVQYTPTVGRYKVYLIDEVHMFSPQSFNALLKTLEEPPPHVKFLLATTDPKKLPVTVLSRCLQFNLKHLASEQIARHLDHIVGLEGVPCETACSRLIAAAASGSVRDALSLLDQAIAYGNGRLVESQVREMLGTIDSTEIFGLLDSVISADAQALLARVDRIAEHNPDFDGILAELAGRLHDVAVAQALGGRADMFDERVRRLSQGVPAEDIQLFYQIAIRGRRDLEISPDPRAGFEMTLIRMLAFRPGGTAAPAGPKISTGGAQIPPRGVVESAGNPVAAPAGQPAPKADDWQQIIDEMALAGLLRELAGHCVLKEHTAGRVHLVLAPSKEHLLKTTQKDRLQEAIRVRFGSNVKLIITVEEPPTETVAERKTREESERQDQAVKSLESDSNVRALIDMFDATLDRNSVRPQQP